RCDQRAVIDDREPRGQPLGLVHEMRRQEDRLALRQQLSQAVPDQMARLWIETRRRLVENQELRIVDERARKRQATLHAARQCANLCARATRESSELEQSRYAHVERRAVDLEI